MQLKEPVIMVLRDPIVSVMVREVFIINLLQRLTVNNRMNSLDRCAMLI